MMCYYVFLFSVVFHFISGVHNVKRVFQSLDGRKISPELMSMHSVLNSFRDNCITFHTGNIKSALQGSNCEEYNCFICQMAEGRSTTDYKIEQHPEINCPPGYREIVDSCFMFVKELLDSDEAHIRCQSTGGGLAHIRNEREFSLISEEIRRQKRSDRSSWHIGLVLRENYVRWRTGFRRSNYPNVPKQLRNQVSCVTLKHDDRFEHIQWDFYSRCSTKARSICRIVPAFLGYHKLESSNEKIIHYVADVTVCRETCIFNNQRLATFTTGVTQSCRCLENVPSEMVPRLGQPDLNDYSCKTDESIVWCFGDSKQICGCGERASVYHLEILQHLGCYKENPAELEKREVDQFYTHRIQKREDITTEETGEIIEISEEPFDFEENETKAIISRTMSQTAKEKHCQRNCWKNRYSYAALQRLSNQQLCHCYHQVAWENYAKQSDNKCYTLDESKAVHVDFFRLPDVERV